MGRIASLTKKIKTTGFFDIFGSSIIVKVVGFLSSIILVRMVTKEEYGVFSYAWNIYSIIMLLSGFGALHAVLQIGSEDAQDDKLKAQIYQYAWNKGSLVNFFLGIAILLLGLFVPLEIGEASFLLCIMCLLPFIQYGSDYQTMYLRTERKNRQYGQANIVNVVLVLCFSIVGSLIWREKGFVFGRYVAYILLVIFGIIFWKVPIAFRKVKLSEKAKKDFWYIALVSMLNGGLSQLLYLADVFLIGMIIPNESIIASYKVATTIPTALSFIPTALITYIFPYFTSHKDDGKWCMKYYGIVTGIMAIFNGLVAITMFFGAEIIITLMFGSAYLDAVIPFRILSISYFFSGTFRSIAGNLLVTQRKLGFNTGVAIFSGILNIIADIFLILWQGSIGAAYATLSVVIFSSILNVFYLIFVFRKK